MAEFCLKCFNELNNTHYTEENIWTEVDFCEGCGEWKPCVYQLYPKPSKSFYQRVLDKIKKSKNK